jgi:hypothetical protein
MQNRDGLQKGPQDHAEGQHGSKTHGKFIEQLHSRGADAAGEDLTRSEPRNPGHHNAVHRLAEDRQQHDAAERESERTRLNRKLEREGEPEQL